MLSNLFSDPIFFVVWVIAVVYAITVHEFSHVLAAYLLGDKTGQDMGRLTLNPLAHIDWLGLAMLMFVGFGWGRPAPYNPYNLRFPKWGPVIVSLAGPAANLITVIFGILILRWLGNSTLGNDSSTMLLPLLLSLVMISLTLMLFNLIPIPPLDGARLLFTILPARFNDFKVQLAQNGPYVLLGLVILDSIIPGLSIFGRLFSGVSQLVYSLL